MIIRDIYATINGDKTTCEFPNGIQIVNASGDTIFEITESERGEIEIRAVGLIRIDGKQFTELIYVAPHASNSVYVSRKPLRQ